MTNSDSLTIVAIATPRGYGGIALIRLSGPKALSIAKRLFVSNQNLSPRRAVFGNLIDDSGTIDTGVVTYFKAPSSYTGEDVVEISIHGNPYLCDLVISACKKLGAVSAGPGEFTQRAFLNGKMDLSQAEGVADITYSSSRAAQSASMDLLRGALGTEIKKIKAALINTITVLELELDFQEDEIDFISARDTLGAVSVIISTIDRLLKTYDWGKIIREGMRCPIIGAPNSGKSSLFNAFLQEERVIVSSLPGTTRDYIEETIRVDNYQIRLVDTAGLRNTNNEIESRGMQKTKSLMRDGNILLYVIDLSDPRETMPKLTPSELKKTCFILNKADIAKPAHLQNAIKLIGNRRYFICSALNHTGVREIATALITEIEKLSPENCPIIITRERHKDALFYTNLNLKRSVNSIRRGAAPEIISIDLREALGYLDVILGKTENDDILNNIFNNFCIGK
ncbi:tRNA uridine-5-carboxymethylaminomethyl(34) synthesis GTPase MnmE [bacterium]|nr:tRNA uridine-5-carboxymethylaminomethyl(34) synthesis GTPase MnmE [bacterium]MBU1633089.1 tRNA uridine-5-carboxymethylaminomethyl(34) synthesis GTPase MnmE [bacterium]MBU1874291.1 tRNA uridine-5-carboxymethylaminomethyl(34) synthesis GTPase MnmE [bacterium]